MHKPGCLSRALSLASLGMTTSVRDQGPDRVAASSREDWLWQTFAACAAVLMVWLIGQLLLIRPDFRHAPESARIQLSFIEPTPHTLPKPPPPAARRTPTAKASAPMPSAVPRPIDKVLAEPPVDRPYTRESRVNLPPGVRIDPLGTDTVASPPGLPSASDKARAKRLLERPNPIDYRPTRFDKAWTTDGTLGDAIAESMDEGLKGMAKALAGPQEQPAQARPPPEVRFNPRLHERPSDLGSEATGDAYKAAPIAFEKAPGLGGEASKRLRGELASLKKQFSHCSAQRWEQVIGPINAHLADLERVEYAYGHGADPVQAEHLLPRSADMAFDQARRALWYAQRRLAACSG